MEVTYPSKILSGFQRLTRCCIPENRTLFKNCEVRFEVLPVVFYKELYLLEHNTDLFVAFFMEISWFTYSSTLNYTWYFPLKFRSTFIWVHNVISHKILIVYILLSMILYLSVIGSLNLYWPTRTPFDRLLYSTTVYVQTQEFSKMWIYVSYLVRIESRRTEKYGNRIITLLAKTSSNLSYLTDPVPRDPDLVLAIPAAV
jgi:hypothetical protein